MKVGINGFGRIGRAVFRINELDPQYEVVAINDIDPNVENHAYLLKYDTVYGKFKGQVSAHNGDMEMVVDDRPIHFYAQENINDVPWEKHDVDIVIDASGVYNNVLLSRDLIDRQIIKKVIVTFSPSDGVDNTIIFGVNNRNYKPANHHIISTSICDSNASGPVLRLLEEKYGIDHGFITTLHPWLAYQNLVDGSLRSVTSPGHFWKDYALGRASTESLIPKPTTLVKALDRVMPITASKLHAFSFRVPTSIVSSSDLTIVMNRSITTAELNELFRKESQSDDSILGYQEEQLVSIDFKGIRESLVVDGRWTSVLNEKTVKLVVWYDNEWGYSNRVHDMAILAGEGL